MARNSSAVCSATSRIGPSSAGTHAAVTRLSSVNDADFACNGDRALGAQQDLRAVMADGGIDFVAEVLAVET